MVDILARSDFVEYEVSSARVITLVRGASSADEVDRRMVALDVGEWWLEGKFGDADGRLLCQVCLWAALIEDRTDNLEDLLDSLHTFAEVELLPPEQAAVLSEVMSSASLTRTEREDYLPAFQSVARGAGGVSVEDAKARSRRAVDLLRGLTSIDDDERASAARLVARGAPFFPGRGEIRCLARVLLHTAVLEVAGSSSRQEQLSTLRFLGPGLYDREDVALIRTSVGAGGMPQDAEAVADL